MQLVVLSGGVGGARMARGLAAAPGCRLTVVVNVADDDIIHGLHVSPDVDTVIYTLAGMEGPHGWGRHDDSWRTMEELARFPGADTSFRLGDLDLALNLYRTGRLAAGHALSSITRDVAAGFGLEASILPVTDDPIRTVVTTDSGELDFQTYFVRRGHRDPIRGVAFRGAEDSTPAPGVLEALTEADAVVIAPSNPVLSIWPVLAIPGIREAVTAAHTVAVSPLIGGKAVKGPTVDALEAVGLEATTAGIVDAYAGLLDGIVIDGADAGTVPPGVAGLATDTRIGEPAASRRLATEVLEWLR